MTPLAPAICEWLSFEETLKFRNDYRSYRIGSSRGAHGEAKHILVDTSVKDVRGADDVRGGDINVATEWRLAYRRFRLGMAEGARGELESLSANLTGAQLRSLPVIQLLQLKRRERAQTIVGDSKGFHVHFGAGRLGLGLILPALQAGPTNYVVIQSQSGVFQNLSKPKNYDQPKDYNDELKDYNESRDVCDVPDNEWPRQVSIQVNDDMIGKLDVFEDEEIFKNLNSGNKGKLFLIKRGEKSQIKKYLIENARSFSCSIGPGINNLIEELFESHENISAEYLLACENNHDEVENMKNKLQGKLRIIPCMVDRICSNIEYLLDHGEGRKTNDGGRKTDDGGLGGSTDEGDLGGRDLGGGRDVCGRDIDMLKVTAEPFIGEIVLMDKVCSSLPFQGLNVIVPRTESQRLYFAERKFLLVNGTHTVLAFLTLLRQLEMGIDFIPPGDFVLLNWHTCTSTERSSLWALTIARLLLIVWEYDDIVLKDAHNVQTDLELSNLLLTYAKQTLLRFSSVTDSTKRVLGGGVDNRFNGRLKNVEEFLNVGNPASTNIGKTILDLSGVGFCTLAAEVHKFVSAAQKVTSKPKKEFIKLPSLSIDSFRPPEKSSKDRMVH